MDRHSTPTRSELKCMLVDENAEPKALSLSLLEEITNGFSEEQEIGRGGFAVVYKGMLDNGVAIAVKKLLNTYMYEKQFHREVECLIKVKHKNVVRFIGYCIDTQRKPEYYNGKFVLADVQQSLLCFEYLPNGTLHRYITDASCGLDWKMRYKIINGICDGLHYLHQNQILHMDLKPPNILLDGNMLPKIADFGLSRCFDQKQSRAITSNIGGTIGYLAPEFGSREITYRFDLYSLGVIIIEILTGKKGYEDVENVIESWSNRLEKSDKGIQREQVRVCTEIGLECIDSNPAKRPLSMQHIIARLHKTGNTEGSIETFMTRSSILQAKTDYDDPDQGVPKAPGGTSSETSSVFGLVDEVPSMVVSVTSSDQLRGISAPKGLGETSTETNSVSGLMDEVSSMAVSATSSDQLRRTSAPKRLGETSTEDFCFSGSSISSPDATMTEQMSEVVLLSVRKTGFILGDKAAKPIIAKLSEKVRNLKELPVNVEQIRNQLIMFSNVIRQIGSLNLTDEVVRCWIGEVRNVAYHVEDIMDKYSYNVLQLQKEGFTRKFFIKGTHYTKVFSEIMDEVVAVEKEILIVIAMKDQWLQPSQLVPNQFTEFKRQNGFRDGFVEFVKDEDLVGIEDNRKLLTGWLYSKELVNTVITVSGMGGLGKSTLVSNVYECEKINFSAHAWIVVSQVYTVESLLRKLLWKIGYTEQPLLAGIDKMDVHYLKKEIQQRLEKTKYLIVLDDVWEQELYIQIHDAFQNLQGSRIVITTRKNNVARISSPTRRLELQLLSKHDAFDLFCRRAFHNQKGHKCPKDLEIIAASIVDRCHGMPLVIVTVANIRTASNLFPEDYPMSRDMLVRLWVAEGFVLSKGNNTPEVVAEGILMELIHRNMLEVVENDELGRVTTCKIHAIVRELAISVAREERFASANDYHTVLQIDKDVRRLSSCGWKGKTALKLKLPHLRTVVLLGVISPSPGMLSSIVSESHYLTVIELEGSKVTEVPTSIGSLFNLRYIGLRHTNVKSLPNSIEDLSNLQTLDVKQTKIQKLPRGLVKIKNLRHLLADRYDDEKKTEFPDFIGVQAPENLSNLEELQTLETIKASTGLAEQLKKLMQLRSVWIEDISSADCEYLFATLSDMPHLSSLLLSARDENEALCFEALTPKSVGLHRLIIRGQWAEGTLHCPIFQSHGTHLKYLALSWCHLGEDPLGMLAPHLPNLTYLKLTNMHSADTLVISADYFPNVKTLVLKHMPDVRELNIIDGALPHIEGLHILSLSNLDKVPRGIESLRSLKKLWLLDLHRNFISKWVTDRMHHKMLHVPEVRI